MSHAKLLRKNCCFLILFSVLIFLIQACATGHRPPRGRLSKAMDKASNQNKGSRVVKTDEHQGHHNSHSPLAFSREDSPERNQNPEDNGEPSLPEGPKPTQFEEEHENTGMGPFGLSAGVGLLKSDDFTEMISLDASIGISEKRSRLEFYLGGAWAGVDHTSELNDSIDNGVSLINVGIDYKRKITAEPKWHSPYFIIGAAYKRMFWQYQNRITTTQGERISSDSLEGVEVYAGLGKNFFQISGNKIGIEVFPSVTCWLPQTTEGFDNDVFDPFFMLNLRAVFSTW
jgi:hypothetical protein